MTSGYGAPVTTGGPFDALIRYRSLTWELAKRDVLGRYRGASFGMLWSLISPFLMLVVYTFAFGGVMQARWVATSNSTTPFAIILFVGLIVHGFFAECLTRAPTLVVSQPNFVKRVIFPLHILPWPAILSALFHTFTNIAVFLILAPILGGVLHWTILLFPLVMLPLVVLMLGVMSFMAAVGVYLRDIGQVTSVVATAALFLSTAIMPLEAVPESFRWIYVGNPLTFIIDQSRAVMLWGRQPDWLGLGLYLLVALMVCQAGHWFFQKTRRGFGDVL